MRTFRLFRFLIRNSHGLVVGMVVAGFLSGAFSAAVLAIISRAVRDGGATRVALLAFVAVVASKIVTTAVSQILLVRFSQGSVLDLSIELSRRILRAPLRVLEQRGGGHILATLTDDVSSVAWAVQTLPQLATNLAVVAGCGIYLAWLSWRMFVGAALVTIVGVLVYRLLHTRAHRMMRETRLARERLFEHFRSLTSGIKELMMHSGRRSDFIVREILPAADECRRTTQQAARHYTLADSWVQILYYGLVGLLLFAYPAVAQPSPEALTGYVFALIYMMSPLWLIIGAVPTLGRGEVSFGRIEELGVSLDDAAAPRGGASSEIMPAAPQEVAIDMRGVQFAYGPAESESHFTLGPLDFTVRSGELVFVIGGNGSGKSTFVKVLTGLYAAAAGEISVNGLQVTDANREAYREHFSVVFADCFLFNRLLGLSSPDLDERARRYLRLLQIDHKVGVRGGALTTTELSSGQRRRLALVTAYLEDRPCYVFDEWAADQDPEYKEVFYRHLLPELRSRGKAVVVITHDDRYFHLGTRVIKLENGRIVSAPEHRPMLPAQPTIRAM